MRRIAYNTILQRAASLYLGNPTPDSKAATAFNVHINKRAQECWESFFWPEWTIVEARTFRLAWNAATTYTAATEVYYRPAGKYAVALTGSTNQPPFTLSGGQWVENNAYWAESSALYDADEYVAATAYTRGAQVFYPTTGKWYQLYAASSTGNPPTDTTKWGELVRFLANIALDQSWQTNTIGEIEGIYDDDPDRNFAASKLDFKLRDVGAVLDPDDGLGEVFVKFRRRCPDWSGATYTSGGATIASGTTVYDSGTGDFYTALATTNAVVTDTTNFVRVDFPYVFRDAVAQLVYADMLRGDGMNEKAALEVAEGFRCLRREFDKIERQQGQHKQLNVKVRT